MNGNEYIPFAGMFELLLGALWAEADLWVANEVGFLDDIRFDGQKKKFTNF